MKKWHGETFDDLKQVARKMNKIAKESTSLSAAAASITERYEAKAKTVKYWHIACTVVPKCKFKLWFRDSDRGGIIYDRVINRNHTHY